MMRTNNNHFSLSCLEDDMFGKKTIKEYIVLKKETALEQMLFAVTNCKKDCIYEITFNAKCFKKENAIDELMDISIELQNYMCLMDNAKNILTNIDLF